MNMFLVYSKQKNRREVDFRKHDSGDKGKCVVLWLKLVVCSTCNAPIGWLSSQPNRTFTETPPTYGVKETV